MELTKCLAEVEVKDEMVNNCTVIDDDGNKGKHDRKHEIDVVHHMKDNKISNDKRQGNKSKSGGSGRHIHQIAEQTGQDGADLADSGWRGADGKDGLDVASV